jgi:hypothetical protein
MDLTRLFQAVCLVLFMSVFSTSQESSKQTPAGRQLAGWLAAYDGTDCGLAGLPHVSEKEFRDSIMAWLSRPSLPR